MPVVLFLCTPQRRPLADGPGFFQHLAGDRAIAWFGGSEPATVVKPSAITAMRERDIDIYGEYPKPWTDEVVRAADVVSPWAAATPAPSSPANATSTGNSPTSPARRRGGPPPIRDDIDARVRNLLAELTTESPARGVTG
jgi:hypothetical protein